MNEKRRQTQWIAGVACAVLGLAGTAAADVIEDNVPSADRPTLPPNFYYWGQSLTTPGGALGWSDITLNFFSEVMNPSTTPYAFGTLYVYSQKYEGWVSTVDRPGNPGFLAASTGVSGNVWQFASSLQLEPATKYWFYTGSKNPVGVAYTSPDLYAGGSLSYQSNPGSPYTDVPTMDLVFRLSGTPIPEPHEYALAAGLGLLGFGIWRRRRAAR